MTKGGPLALAPDLTVCICTRDRPEDLHDAIGSVLRNAPGASVVVSEDGQAVEPTEFRANPSCRWQQGPGSGLGANRNAAVRAVDTAWVLFLDDDARVGADFIAEAERCLAAVDEAHRPRTIVTGRELNNGELVTPHDVDFLGFQRRDYRAGDELHTVVINAALWPSALFDTVEFDEHLRYGSDEVDLSYAALAAGFSIQDCPKAVNDHHPSSSGRSNYALDAQASRLRATTKRYWRLRGERAKAVLFLGVAPVHLALAQLRREGLSGLSSTLSVLKRWLA